MLVGPDRYEEVFDKLKEFVTHQGSRVHVFVGPTTDGLAATRILAWLLRSQNVAYDIVPVRTLHELQSAAQKMMRDRDAAEAVVMINCGGMLNVPVFFSCGPGSLYVIVDSHVPYDLSSVYEHEGVVYLLADVSQSEDSGVQIPTEETYRWYLEADGFGGAEFEDDSEAYSSSDDDDETGYVEDEFGVRRRGAGDDGGPGRARKRRKGMRGTAMMTVEERVIAREERKRAMQKAKQIVTQYYASSSYWSSAATVMYVLASRLGCNENRLLWLGIVGLTDQYVHERISTRAYEAMFSDFYAREVMSNNVDDDGETSAVREHRISLIDDYRFLLYRHWNLYDAMYNSPYVAARLGVWKEPGRQKLNTMLAKMGLRLSEARQKFMLMSSASKSVLSEQIYEAAAEWDLHDVQFPSFQMKHMYSMPLSASDVVAATSALLEAPGGGATGKSGAGSGAEARPDGESGTHVNFWRAYDALHLKNDSQLKAGLDAAIEMQQAIVRLGTMLIETRAISPNSAYIHTVINESPDLPHVTSPLGILRLANFLVDTLREAGKPRKPLVVAALNHETDSYLVVAVSSAPKHGMIENHLISGIFYNVINDLLERDLEGDEQLSLASPYWQHRYVDVDREDLGEFLDAIQHDMVEAGAV